jgi:hypothetical protein
VRVFASNSEVCGIKVFNRLRGIIHGTKKKEEAKEKEKAYRESSKSRRCSLWRYSIPN